VEGAGKWRTCKAEVVLAQGADRGNEDEGVRQAEEKEEEEEESVRRGAQMLRQGAILCTDMYTCVIISLHMHMCMCALYTVHTHVHTRKSTRLCMCAYVHMSRYAPTHPPTHTHTHPPTHPPTQ